MKEYLSITVSLHDFTFYEGRDDTTQAIESEIYKTKLKMLESNGITVFRVHDAMHWAN